MLFKYWEASDVTTIAGTSKPHCFCNYCRITFPKDRHLELQILVIKFFSVLWYSSCIRRWVQGIFFPCTAAFNFSFVALKQVLTDLLISKWSKISQVLASFNKAAAVWILGVFDTDLVQGSDTFTSGDNGFSEIRVFWWCWYTFWPIMYNTWLFLVVAQLLLET